MEVTVLWDMLTAGWIPNIWVLVVVLIVGQLTKQYTHFVCCQTWCFLQQGGRAISIHCKVAFLILGFVNDLDTIR